MRGSQIYSRGAAPQTPLAKNHKEFTPEESMLPFLCVGKISTFYLYRHASYSMDPCTTGSTAVHGYSTASLALFWRDVYGRGIFKPAEPHTHSPRGFLFVKWRKSTLGDFLK